MMLVDVIDEQDLIDRLLSLPHEEFQERILLLQEIMMDEILEEKEREGKIVFYEVENGLLN